MYKDDLTRLHHMLDAAREAVIFTQNRTRADLDTDRMLTLALVKCVEIVGEAAAHIPDESQALYPGIPWRQITGMRNRLVHGYFDIDLDILWGVVMLNLPPLITALEQIVPSE